jgi:hypothetical protein
MTHPTKLHRIDSAALRELYQIVDEIKSEDVATAEKRVKIGLTRMRVKLSQVGKLCRDARKDLLEMRDGKIRRT